MNMLDVRNSHSTLICDTPACIGFVDIVYVDLGLCTVSSTMRQHDHVATVAYAIECL
jgi:hypothetical protein